MEINTLAYSLGESYSGIRVLAVYLFTLINTNKLSGTVAAEW